MNSHKEFSLLEQFSLNASDLNEDKETLLRFLRARDGDIFKAEEMLRSTVKWREVNNLDSFKSWEPPKVLAEDYIVEFLGIDYQGYPVVYVPLGRWNIRDRIKDGYLEETRNFRLYILEVMITQFIEKTQRDQIVVVFDMTELSFYKVANMETMNVVIKMCQDFESNYPERLRTGFVINCPWVFPHAFNLVKPFLAPKTLSKIQIFDGNKSKWLPAINEVFSRDLIPEQALRP